MHCIKGARVCVVGSWLAAACGGGGASDEDGGTTTNADDTSTSVMTTILTLPPLDGTSDGDDATAGTDEGTTSEGTTSDDTAGTTAASESSGGSSSSGEPAESSDGGPTSYEVQWCILQYPPMVEVDVDMAFTVYVRVFAPGLTDQSGVTDPAPELVVEVGYSVDGSDPSTGVGEPWTWEAAMPNGGYGPGAPGYGAANDEYQHDLAIPTAGIFDYAARISGDSGATWVYCDLDGLTVGGYTPDQAGDAAVGQ